MSIPISFKAVIEAHPQESIRKGNATCDILATLQPKFWNEDEDNKATYYVLVKNEQEGEVSATLLGWPDCKAFAASREEALVRLQELVNVRLAEAEIVAVQILSTQSQQSWLELANQLNNNPLFDEVLTNIEAYRHEIDAEIEAHYHELDVPDEAK